MDSAADWVERALGYRFRDPAAAATALTHRSAGARHNERLEFLGDALLSFLVAERLYGDERWPDEGALTRQRAALVNGAALAEIAAELGLGEALILGPGELKSGGFRRASILADALEAVLGAIYLEGGLAAARAAVLRVLEPRLEAHAEGSAKDPKTRLQEYLQGLGLPLPRYAVEAVTGDRHEQIFAVSCEIVDPVLRTAGEGPSRRRAEQAAASRALRALGLPAEERP
jgi:ribonuclease-3